MNLARDRWRARRRATPEPRQRPGLPVAGCPATSPRPCPASSCCRAQRQPLPVQQRAVLVLRLWQDHSVNETAAAVRPWRPIRQAVRPPRPHVTFRDASSSWPWAPDPICAGMASWPLAAVRRTRRSAAAAVAHGAPAWSRSMVLSPCAFPAGIAGVAAGEERGDLLAAAARPVPWAGQPLEGGPRAASRRRPPPPRGCRCGGQWTGRRCRCCSSCRSSRSPAQLCCAAGGVVGRGRPAA